MRTIAIANAVVLLAAGVQAGAAEFPYSGYFVAGTPDQDLEDVRLGCAHSFFRQDADGTFVDYHLDLEGYERVGVLRYLQYARGTCTRVDGAPIDSCTMMFSTDRSEIGSVYVDVVESTGPDIIRLRSFDNVQQAQSFLAGGAAPAEASFFLRCSGFTDEALADHLTTAESRLDLDALYAVITPNFDAVTRARMQNILDRLSNNR